MATYGIKVSKQGYDVKTATGDKLFLNSEQECLKIENKIIGTIHVPSLQFSWGQGFDWWTGYNDYQHNLGFTPVVRLFERSTYWFENNLIEAPSFFEDRFSPTGPFVGYGYKLYCLADSSKIRVKVELYYMDCGIYAFDIDYILYIFANKIES